MSFAGFWAGVMGGALGQPDAQMPASANSFCSSAGTVTIGFRFPSASPGDIEAFQGCTSWNDVGDYVASKGGQFDPDLWECMCSVNSGPNPTTGPALDTWLQLNVNRSWSWAAPGQFNSGNWTMSVREIANTGNTDSMTYTWNTEDGS